MKLLPLLLLAAGALLWFVAANALLPLPAWPDALVPAGERSIAEIRLVFGLMPRAVVALLRFAWQAPWRDAFVAALARPGTGTLVGWPALPPVAAKTGTLRHTLSLAGLIDPDVLSSTGGATPAEPILFAILLDHDLRDRGVQRREVAEFLRQWRRLAGGAS